MNRNPIRYTPTATRTNDTAAAHAARARLARNLERTVSREHAREACAAVAAYFDTRNPRRIQP
jgi:hypothetical protein